MPAFQHRCSWVNVLLAGTILILLIYVLQLGSRHAIYLWDESIYVNNSLEMERSGNYLVYTVDGIPDHHNSKPPLVLWMQALSYKVFGYSETAARIPTFLALAGTLGLCIFYSRKLLASFRPGLIACLIILLTPGLIRNHVFLSADLDGMLVFWCSFIFLHHLGVIRQKLVSPKDLYVYALLFSGGFLTKSTAVLLILPALALSFAVNGQLRGILKQKACYLAAAVFLCIVVAYYVIREPFDPGYWNVVWFSEFTRATENIQPWLEYPWDMYFLFLREQFFRHPLMLLVAVGPGFLLIRGQGHKKLFLHALLIACMYLIAISIPPVKLVWYDAPVYPLLALATGIAFSGLIRFVFASLRPLFLREAFGFLLVAGLAAGAFIPFRSTLERQLAVYLEPEESTRALRDFARRRELRHLRVVEEINEARFMHARDALRFYQKTICFDRGADIAISNYAACAQPGETVMSCQAAKLDSLSQRFAAVTLDSCGPCRMLQL